MISFVTATPAAVHFSIIQMLLKKSVYQELTVSSNYWEYYLPSDEPPENAKLIKWLVGDIDDMVRAMGSSAKKQCALALQSSVTKNDDIEKEAK